MPALSCIAVFIFLFLFRFLFLVSLAVARLLGSEIKSAPKHVKIFFQKKFHNLKDFSLHRHDACAAASILDARAIDVRLAPRIADLHSNFFHFALADADKVIEPHAGSIATDAGAL